MGWSDLDCETLVCHCEVLPIDLKVSGAISMRFPSPKLLKKLMDIAPLCSDRQSVMCSRYMLRMSVKYQQFRYITLGFAYGRYSPDPS
jgi:hypothetical protein